ncbi:MAG: D-glucuronyl C5-epimerase family protein [bacterium]
MIAVIGTGCSAPEPEVTPNEYGATALGLRQKQGFVDLPWERLPNIGGTIEGASTYVEPLDADSIEMWEYRGGRYYHAVNLCHRCMGFLSVYRQTGDRSFLARTEKYARKLMSRCINIDGALYAPIDFKYAVHGDSSVVFNPTWYSGMPQGELLEVLVRLFEITDDSAYLDYSHGLFESFLRPSEPSGCGVVRVDGSGYYWIEEYPHGDAPGMTLNGFVASLFGVYDYLRVTKSPEARIVWEVALTTLKHYLPEYRRRGKTSYYCLGHKHLATREYHAFHISQLRSLARMTDDGFFTIMADVLETDAVAHFKEDW